MSTANRDTWMQKPFESRYVFDAPSPNKSARQGCQVSDYKAERKKKTKEKKLTKETNERSKERTKKIKSHEPNERTKY